MSAWLIYLWTRLDTIDCLLFVLSITLSFCVGITGLVGFADDNEESKKVFKKLLFPTILVSFLSVIIPTKEDVALIYVLPKLVNREIVMKDCPEIAKLGIEALKQQLIEFTKTKENKQ